MYKFAGYYASLLQACVLYLVILEFTQSKKVTIDNNMCSFKVFDVSNKKSKTVLWDGRALMKNCRIGFSLPNDKYRFVIVVKKYVIKDCNFTLSYFYGHNYFARKTYGCNSSPQTHRSQYLEYLYVQFDTSRASTSTVELKVSGELHQGDTSVSPGWIGASAAIIVAFLLMYCIKKMNRNICQVCGDCCDFCCGFIVSLLPSCCKASSDDFALQFERHSETVVETTEPSRRLSVSSISIDDNSVCDITLVEPTAPLSPGHVTNYETPSYERPPPPSYEKCVKDEPPPPYPGNQ